jgi:hypothetical protein
MCTRWRVHIFRFATSAYTITYKCRMCTRLRVHDICFSNLYACAPQAQLKVFLEKMCTTTDRSYNLAALNKECREAKAAGIALDYLLRCASPSLVLDVCVVNTLPTYFYPCSVLSGRKNIKDKKDLVRRIGSLGVLPALSRLYVTMESAKKAKQDPTEKDVFKLVRFLISLFKLLVNSFVSQYVNDCMAALKRFDRTGSGDPEPCEVVARSDVIGLQVDGSGVQFVTIIIDNLFERGGLLLACHPDKAGFELAFSMIIIIFLADGVHILLILTFFSMQGPTLPDLNALPDGVNKLWIMTGLDVATAVAEGFIPALASRYA